MPCFLALVGFSFTVPFGREAYRMNPPSISRRKPPAVGRQKKISSVTVIGLGNWGTSLVAGLKAAGIHPREVVVRSEPARMRPDSNITTLNYASLDAQLIWLCVPDRTI